MPSPFPGMDPWLESPLSFGGLHSSMITFVKASLQTRLPEPYYADSEDRIYVDVEVRVPDVNVLGATSLTRRRATAALPSQRDPNRSLSNRSR